MQLSAGALDRLEAFYGECFVGGADLGGWNGRGFLMLLRAGWGLLPLPWRWQPLSHCCWLLGWFACLQMRDATSSCSFAAAEPWLVGLLLLLPPPSAVDVICRLCTNAVLSVMNPKCHGRAGNPIRAFGGKQWRRQKATAAAVAAAGSDAVA